MRHLDEKVVHAEGERKSKIPQDSDGNLGRGQIIHRREEPALAGYEGRNNGVKVPHSNMSLPSSIPLATSVFIWVSSTLQMEDIAFWT